MGHECFQSSRPKARRNFFNARPAICEYEPAFATMKARDQCDGVTDRADVVGSHIAAGRCT
jgi:hypothetical protein